MFVLPDNDALEHILHQAFFGGIAATGFGVLFNLGRRDLSLCFLSGMFALAMRTIGLNAGWSLEAASFVASLALTSIVTCVIQPRLRVSCTMIALTACIPMVPGAFLAQAILGLFSVTAPNPAQADVTIVQSIQALLRAGFTVCALGTGLALPTSLTKTKIL